MSLPIVVMKFGGTSVENAEAFERVSHIIGAQKRVRPIIVVSAMSGVTDALVSSFRLATKGSPHLAAQSLDRVYQRHLNVAQHLLQINYYREYRAALELAECEIGKLFYLVAEMDEQMHPSQEDCVISHGEQLSAKLLTFVMATKKLPPRYVDARRCIITDDAHGCSVPLFDQTMLRSCRELTPIIERGEIPVLGGFIGATESDVPTTLGRNGSDYTAALVGAALNTSEIQIWTDVTGVLTADPRLVDEPRTVPLMSYEEATELSRLGSRVIYPQAIQPVAARNIPLRICNSRAPHEEGTLITAAKTVSPGIIKSIAHKPGLVSLRIKAPYLSGPHEFLKVVFDALRQHRISVDAVKLFETSVSMVLSEKVAAAAVEAMQQPGEIEMERGRALISIVGAGLHTNQHATTRAIGAIGDLNASFSSKGDSGSSVCFLVDQEKSIEAVRRLHQAFFEEAEKAAAVEPLQFRESPIDCYSTP